MPRNRASERPAAAQMADGGSARYRSDRYVGFARLVILTSAAILLLLCCQGDHTPAEGHETKIGWQPAMPVIGVLRTGTLANVPQDRVTALRQGLKGRPLVPATEYWLGFSSWPPASLATTLHTLPREMV